ncbi:MAG TPA: GntG family PLP-dependent aldolase [Gemmatimonadales bacterium]
MTKPRVVDLRSDTVTQPGRAMRQAMMDAEVGDDVLDGDPTTRRLEERVAELLGMEAALFFPSGTQANQAGISLVTEPGTELIADAGAHVIHYEMAGVAALSGVQVRPVATPDGHLTPDTIRAAWRPASPHLPRVSAITVENTHNGSGGRVLSPLGWDAIVGVAGELGVPIHLDGARLWNAATAAGVPPGRLARGATTVMVSLSKGLGCPVGSCLAGDTTLTRRARTIRKRLGGGMRQSGLLAAAGLYALDHHLSRLAEDHANAARIAMGLAGLDTIKVVAPETNILMVDLMDSAADAVAAASRLAGEGVLVVPMGPRRLRIVTHLDVSRDDVEWATERLAATLS